MADQRANIVWRDGGVPVSSKFDDPYYSLDNGLAEARHVFLDGNGLPERCCNGFQVAELGFGTGLNVLALAKALERTQTASLVSYTSFEAHPVTATDMERALDAFPDVREFSKSLISAWRQGHLRADIGPNLKLEVVLGDARETMPVWSGSADAWFLDGFSPAKNPELWGEDLLAEVARHTNPGGTAATYTAAGQVRRALITGGFEVERRAGFGRKRHMTVARMPK